MDSLLDGVLWSRPHVLMAGTPRARNGPNGSSSSVAEVQLWGVHLRGYARRERVGVRGERRTTADFHLAVSMAVPWPWCLDSGPAQV